MKKIAFATAVAIGLGFLSVPAAPDANAAIRVVVAPYGYYGYMPRLRPWRPLNVPVYLACRKKVFAKYSFSPAALFMVDDCYTGLVPVR
jgi:hypothetical protein